VTGVRELAEVRVVSAAPDEVRVSVLGGPTQLDVTLPLDAPVAILVPDLVKRVRSRAGVTPAPAEVPSPAEANHEFWALSRGPDTAPFSPDTTLRDAGIGNGELLHLRPERALSAPALYDDVVDAAARLNRAAFAGWDASAARWMAFTGLQVTSMVWVYFLLADRFGPNRPVMVGLSAVLALTLVGMAALAHRSYRQTDVATALGWAAIPVSAAIAWALVTPLGGYWRVAGCAALLVALAAYHRVIGTGHWGYLAAGVAGGIAGIGLTAHAVGLSAVSAGTVLATLSVLGCLAVPALTARESRPPTPAGADDGPVERALFENLFESTPPGGPAGRPSEVTTPTAEDVWSRVRSATLTRSALYTGLSAGAAVAATVVCAHQDPPQWSGLAFAAVCSLILGLFARRPRTALERASLGLPAVALAAATAWQAQQGGLPMALTAVATLLVIVVGSAAVGAGTAARTTTWSTALAYVEYLACAALIPLGLWVLDLYRRAVEG
jgi:type VII secretion integral membrane protein EccD